MKPERHTSTKVDTIEITPAEIKKWKLPDVQRELKINDKVRELVEWLKQQDGVLPGIITVGVLDGEKYKLDGQHRLEAFILTGLPVGYCDVRYYYAKDMADMGEEFVRLNSALVRLKPDDILRALERSNEPLQYIRKRCPFVGYGAVRRSPKAPVVSMSVLIRCWAASATETPATSGGSALNVARALSPTDAKEMCDFMVLAEKAWGRAAEYARLYSGLNLTLCMWVYRRTVGSQVEPHVTPMQPELFQKCLMALSADTHYLDHLVGRTLNERFRAPTYGLLSKLIQSRYKYETGKRARLPQPTWATHTGLRTVRGAA